MTRAEVAAIPAPSARAVELSGVLLPGLVNAHDELSLSVLGPAPPGPHADPAAWADALLAGPAARALGLGVVDRLWLGGLRNLLCGVTAVVHHAPFHRVLQDDAFPVRVQARYGFTHAARGDLRRRYRTTDRRIPWFVRMGEGAAPDVAAELAWLVEQNVLRHNTVLVHAIGVGPDEAARLALASACVVTCPESERHLYGRTADLAVLRAAGVRVGLGSDSPLAGARDLLSTLATVEGDDALDLATRASAEVARLPLGGFAPGDPADLVLVSSVPALLRGDRTAIDLVLVAGAPRYGRPQLLDAAGVAAVPLTVDGAPRALDAGLARRLRSILRDLPGPRPPWLAGVLL